MVKILKMNANAQLLRFNKKLVALRFYGIVFSITLDNSSEVV